MLTIRRILIDCIVMSQYYKTFPSGHIKEVTKTEEW